MTNPDNCRDYARCVSLSKADSQPCIGCGAYEPEGPTVAEELKGLREELERQEAVERSYGNAWPHCDSATSESENQYYRTAVDRNPDRLSVARELLDIIAQDTTDPYELPMPKSPAAKRDELCLRLARRLLRGNNA